MLKEQKWVLERIKKGDITVWDLLLEAGRKFEKGLAGSSEQDGAEIEDIVKFLGNAGYLRAEKVKSIEPYFLERVVGPGWLTEKGHKYGKWNWEKIANWSLTILGLGLATSTFYFQFFVNNTDKL